MAWPNNSLKSTPLRRAVGRNKRNTLRHMNHEPHRLRRNTPSAIAPYLPENGPMKRLLAILLLTVIAPCASAKCGAISHLITGSVVDADGAPIAGALVGASWMRLSRPDGPALTLTDEHGRYSISILFDTWTTYSVSNGDECDGALGQVSLSASTKTLRSMPELVSVGNDPELEAPALRIEYPPLNSNEAEP
jgi:hypothetical protein